MKLFVALFLITIIIRSQSIVLEYDYFFQKDTLDSTTKSEKYYTIDYGKENYFVAESEINLYEEKLNNGKELMSNGMNVITGDGINRRPSRLNSIYFNKDGETYFFKNYLNQIKIKYSKPVENQWILKNDTLTYHDFPCKVATTHYSGRNYTAYYTQKIPKSLGPYVFKGLPGAIVYVSDDTKSHVFELVGVEKKDIKFDLTDFSEVEKKDSDRIEYEWKTEPFKLLMPEHEMPDVQRQKFKRKLKEKLKKDNNPIELTDE